MIVVGVCIVILVAIIWLGILRAPRGEAPVSRWAEYPEPPPIVRHEHVHRIDWPEAPPGYVPLEELTPAARALVEGGE